MAREALLDAIEALVAQLDAIIVVGAGGECRRLNDGRLLLFHACGG